MTDTTNLNMLSLEGMVLKSWAKVKCCIWSEHSILVITNNCFLVDVFKLDEDVAMIFCNINFVVFLEFKNEFDGDFAIGGAVMLIRTLLIRLIHISHLTITGGGVVCFRHCRRIYELLLRRSYGKLVPWCKVQQPI